VASPLGAPGLTVDPRDDHYIERRISRPVPGRGPAGSATADQAEAGHLLGDVPALLLVAGALAFLTPRGTTLTAVTDLGTRRVA